MSVCEAMRPWNKDLRSPSRLLSSGPAHVQSPAFVGTALVPTVLTLKDARTQQAHADRGSTVYLGLHVLCDCASVRFMAIPRRQDRQLLPCLRYYSMMGLSQMVRMLSLKQASSGGRWLKTSIEHYTVIEYIERFAESIKNIVGRRVYHLIEAEEGGLLPWRTLPALTSA